MKVPGQRQTVLLNPGVAERTIEARLSGDETQPDRQMRVVGELPNRQLLD